MELNLRRNKISAVQGVEALSIQRIFLSNNLIKSFDSIQTIFHIKALVELSLDGNPVASNRSYREYLLDQIKALRHLDLKKVGDDEKKGAPPSSLLPPASASSLSSAASASSLHAGAQATCKHTQSHMRKF